MKRIAVLAALAFAVPTLALGQTAYPTRPVTIIVPFAAGGPTDVITRLLAEELSKIWKQQVIVESKPGGGSVVGSAAAARAKPDGYTLLQVSGSFVVNAAARTNLPYDATKDFDWIGVFSEGPLGIVASSGFGPSSLPELIKEARSRPADKPLTFASPGVGSPAHMAGELIQQKTGVKLEHVPYAGEAPAITDVLSGRVDFYIGTWANQRPYVEAGKFKPISILYGSRLPEVPNTPTAAEEIPDLELPLNVFNAIAAPAGTPPDILAKISAGIKSAVDAPTFKDRIAAMGAYPKFTTIEESRAYYKRELGVWTATAKAAGVRLD